MDDLALDGSSRDKGSGSGSGSGSGAEPQVEILMATHNGDKYLSAQIESILAQDYNNILLTIFDDGSTDGTIRCIEQYVDTLGNIPQESPVLHGDDDTDENIGGSGNGAVGGGDVPGAGGDGNGVVGGGGHRVRLVGSERIGLPAVFFHLLSFVDSQSYYIGYADQDDLWLPGKVSRAVKLLDAKPLDAKPFNTKPLDAKTFNTKLLDGISKDMTRSGTFSKRVEDRPTLCCSRVFIADEQLQVTGITPIPERGASFANALVQGIAPGSTMLFDRKAAGLLASFTPQDSPMHDWWTYLVVSAVGDVIFDQLPGLLYRQHDANARGVGDNGRWSWRKRILWHFQEGAHSSTRQAAELRQWLASSPGMLPELDDFLDSQRTLIRRARYCITGSAHRQRKIDDLVFRILYLLGRI